MNYLGHYVYNHAICRLEPQPYFVVGVALPDLWPRLSRKRRIRWRAVRAATVSDPCARQLRAGLLNHVAVDQRFHALPSFLGWQRELKARLVGRAPRPVLTDFLAHLALELVLDHRVICADSQVGESIYDHMALCDPEVVEQQMGTLGNVDARGLAQELQDFVRERFLPRFAQRDTLMRVVDSVLGLTNLHTTPSKSVIRELLDAAQELVEPEIVWAEMGAREPVAARRPHGSVANTSAKGSAV
jgi:hypothetical protein